MSEPKEKSRSPFGYWDIIVLACIIGLVVAIAQPRPIGPRRSGSDWNANVCINNLHQIDAAINEWALEKGKTNGPVVTENDIKPYLKLGPDGQLPKCPMGGKYIFGKVGNIPQVTCSLGTTVTPAHVLP